MIELMLIGNFSYHFSMGAPITFEFYQNYQLQSEENKFISFLETAVTHP